jgi:peptide/nickel transport system substrate-binding protein
VLIVRGKSYNFGALNLKRRLGVSVVMLAVGGFLLASSFAGVGAGSRGRTDSTFVKRGGTLRVAGWTDVDYVDPALAYTPHSTPLVLATCATLFRYADKDGAAGAQVVKEVARKFSVSHHGRTYTFDLKRSFKFHTGEPVTARSFAVAFNRDADPKMNSPAQQYLHEIVGADAVMTGKATRVSGVRVLGRYRLQIRLTKAIGDLIPRLTLWLFCPLPPNTPVDPRGIDNPPGSGPYFVAERIINNRVVLKRNPFYPGGRPANVNQIIYTVLSSDACLLKTERNEIDLCVQPAWSPDTWQQLAKRYGINKKRFFVRPESTIWFVVFNHDRQAFRGRGQIPLEKAINYAIDRPALVRAYRVIRAGTPTDQMLPTLGRNERIYPLRGVDPTKARRWLQKARYKPRRLVLYWVNGSPDAANSIAFDLNQIGIEVEVKLFSPKEHFQRAGTRGEPFDMAFFAWQPDYIDGAAFFVPLASGSTLRAQGNSNASYFNDGKVNAKIVAANQKRGKARRKAWADLDIYLMRNNPPWAPFLNSVNRQFVSASFGCYVYTPAFGVNLVAACKR